MSRLALLNQGMLDDALKAHGRDRGAGTSLPTTDLRRGDVYEHTGLGCLMVYTGAGWRQVHLAEVASSAARDVLNATAGLHPGFRTRVAADNTEWLWDGDSWDYLTGPSTPSFEMTYGAGWAAYTEPESGSGWAGLRAWRRNGIVTVTGAVKTTAAVANLSVVASFPQVDGWAPPNSVQGTGSFQARRDGTIRVAGAQASGYITSFTITYAAEK